MFHTPPTFPPIVIKSNLWIFISTLTTQGSAITMICTDKVTCSSLFQQPLYILKLPPAYRDTSRHFHLPPLYEDHTVTMHVSLDRVNLNTINISTLDFHIWQHFDSNWTTVHMQKMADVPEVPVAQLYKHMIGQNEPIPLFEINRHMEEGPSLTWKLLAHTRTYIGTISMTLIVCIGLYCLKDLGSDPGHTKGPTLLPSLIVTCYCG